MNLKEQFPAQIYRSRPSDFAPAVEVGGCLLECRGKYLFLFRAAGTLCENTWGMPAGKLEKEEQPLVGTVRETFEETGIKLDKSKLRNIGKFFARKTELDYVYHLYHQEFSDFPDVQLNFEHQECRWVTLEKP